MRPLWNRNVLERFICKYAFVTRVLLLEFDRESTRQNIKHDLLVVKPVVLEINGENSAQNNIFKLTSDDLKFRKTLR